MGRSSTDFILPGRAEDLRPVIESYLFSEGYKAKQLNGELVYQKGDGLMMGPSFFRYLANGNNARLEVWMKYAILPGVYAGEIDNNSFVGAAVKGPLKNRVNYIEMMIMQNGGQVLYRNAPINPSIFPTAYMMYQQPQMQQPMYQQPQMQQPMQPAQPVQQPAQPQQNTIVCPNCGNSNLPGAAFCSGCGAKL